MPLRQRILGRIGTNLRPRHAQRIGRFVVDLQS